MEQIIIKPDNTQEIKNIVYKKTLTIFKYMTLFQ